MSASAKCLEPKFNFRADTSGPADHPSAVCRAKSSAVSQGNAGRLAGAAGLYVFFVSGLLWSQPAWMVVFAPLVQLGVGRSLFSYFGGDERRHLTGR